MIKKILGLLIVGLSFIGFSSAWNYTVQTVGLEESPSLLDNQYTVTFLKGGGFLTSFLSQGKPLLALNSNNFVFWNNGKLYVFYNYDRHGYGHIFTQGYYAYYNSCDEITGFDYNPSNANCSPLLIQGDYQSVFKNFFDNVISTDYVYYYYDGFVGDVSSYENLNICFSSHRLHKSICFLLSQGLTGTLYLSSDTTFGLINRDLLHSAPGQYGYISSGSSSDVGVVPTSDESAINYFENSYGRNESICYAGINDCTTLYGSPVSFNEGNGLDIFQLYQCIYNSNPDPINVYVWMNTWLLNYNQWVKKNGNPDYLATYNTGFNQVDLYFTGFSSPFVGNPVALYFLMDNVESYNSGLWDDQSWGNSEELVSYCNIKVNSGSFEDITNDNVKKNIVDYTENANTNKGYNPDGSKVEIDYSQFGSYSGINFSGGTSVQNTFSGFFSKISDAVDVVSFTTTNRILPAFIVNAFIFVVLFKLLRKK